MIAQLFFATHGAIARTCQGRYPPGDSLALPRCYPARVAVFIFVAGILN